MEIFQWLLKFRKEPERSSESYSNNSTDHDETNTTITSYTDLRAKRSSSIKGSKHKNKRSYKGVWSWCCSEDVAKVCFYSTLTLRRLSSLKREHWIHSMAKMKTEGGGESKEISTRFDLKRDIIKILEPEKQDETNNEKKKTEQSKSKATLSRMKELIRWAAATKSDKAALFFTPKIMIELRNRRKLKMMKEVNEESKKSISLRWESSESCTTVSSSSSDHNSIVTSEAIFVSLGPTPLYRCKSRKGNWITTDSEFVVLEL